MQKKYGFAGPADHGVQPGAVGRDGDAFESVGERRFVAHGTTWDRVGGKDQDFLVAGAGEVGGEPGRYLVGEREAVSVRSVRGGDCRHGRVAGVLEAGVGEGRTLRWEGRP
ncbi:hypothetical protein AB0958_43135 [Streptomyces sp. NPDC006655]|uniref:hypothetical protein n=1 Tax=Streptomyces sp. NPDC006655 TaxID=3156898 RepID=UPI0034532225